MGKESRIRNHRRNFKVLASRVAAESGTTIGDIAFTFFSQAKSESDTEKVQAIRWFTKAKNSNRTSE